MKTTFKETQKFTQKWLWSVLIIGFLFSILVIFIQRNELSGNNFYYILLFNIAIHTLTLLLLYSLKLKTEINNQLFSFQYVPFRKRTFHWPEILSAEVIDYGFIGGWGIRFWTKYGTVYNVSGSKGLFIKLKNGKQFLVGTQKIDELEKALKEITL